MNAHDTGVLTLTLVKFLGEITAGYGRLHAQATYLMGILAVIDIALAFLWYAFSRKPFLGAGLQRFFYYSILLYIVNDWSHLINDIADTAISWGLLAGGSTMTLAEFSNPSKVAELGLIATEPIFLHIRNYGILDKVANGIDVIVTGFSGLVILAAFFVTAIQIFVQFLEFYLCAVLGSILVIFAVNQRTAFIAEGVFASMLSHGIRFLVLSFIASLTFPVLVRFQLSPDPSLGTIFGLLLAVWSLTVFCWRAHHIAMGFLSHTPVLTASTYGAAGVAGAMVAGWIGGGAVQGARRASRVLQAATRV